MNEKGNLERIASGAYEAGEPILLDYEFDLLADNGLNLDTRSFRRKVEHPILMGSLDKKKSEDAVVKFLGNNVRWVEISPKYDGASLRLSYVDGQLVGGVSRGNGYVGEDWTDNLLLANVVKTLKKPATVEVRAEAIISQCHADKFETNLRGIVPGMLRASDSRPELALVDVIAFEIFGEGLVSQADKRQALRDLFPDSHRVETQLIFAHNEEIEEHLQPFFVNPFATLEKAFAFWQERLDYAIDGLVLLKGLSGIDAPLPVQDSLKPSNRAAVKFGDEGYPAEVGKIRYQLGLYGVLTPVLDLAEAVEIDSTMVAKASASNYALLKAAGLGVGAKIEICKSGDIIPFCKAVIDPSQDGLELPLCPECGEQSILSDTGVQALCVNDDCRGGSLVKLQRFFEIFAIAAVSDATIESLFSAGYDSLESIFSLTVSDLVKLDGFAEKSARYLIDSLKSISLSEAQVIKAAGLKGLGERKGKVLLSSYASIDDLVERVTASGMDKVSGFGPIQSKMIEENIHLIAETKARFTSLGIRVESANQNQSTADQQKTILICATGAAPMKRNEFEAHIQKFGYVMQSSVNKETQILVCADPSGNSSKLKKARSLGIQILDYAAFLSQIETRENNTEQDTVSPPASMEHESNFQTSASVEEPEQPQHPPCPDESNLSLFSQW